MDPLIFALFSIIYLVLLIKGFKVHLNGAAPPYSLALFFVTLGLIYDNGVLAAGKFIGTGKILETLTYLRFWLHALLTPVLVLFAWGALVKLGVNWANTRAAHIAAWIYTIWLVIIELITVTLKVNLKPAKEYGALKYIPENGSGTPVMVILLTVPLLISAIYLLKKRKWGWMLAGVVLMAAGGMVQLPLDSAAITNAFEVILLISLWQTAHFLQKEDRGSL